jgi:hypothetical protein
MNAHGSPSELVAAGYRWLPGTELAAVTNGNGNGRRPRRPAQQDRRV